MPRWAEQQKLLDRPLTALCLIFLFWKVFLVVTLLSSPGIGYDTSGSILLRSTAELSDAGISQRLAARLLRWDAIYFAEVSRRDYVHEQEWAFSWALTRVFGWFGRGALERDQGEI